ncbi:prolyl-tRNA synthetase associated domain-containing protein [Hyphomonas jannaschiana]|uniref:YbaK/prolyl-tRNA synthetase domain-containing protein n=1 Tax=Hyphomonas jannaschiana VP2 TaxID=1280952 RepID=A0A059FD86_9PROT|nr:prolyl-tRNA synthetase associated domain-containing protein [Hyphomonas jannaschiana]KCZ88605.1 YbaK/prolyl-tRNA synthetase domain-containing protein [Hyphomonas jannaschiana VP2]
MTATPEDLFAYLDTLGIAHTTHWHEAVFTVDQGKELKAAMPGGHTKNLFLKDNDGAIILIAAEAHSQLKLNKLHRLIGTKRLSFGPPELMEELLGVTPGSVTAFALMNDKTGRVRFLVDAALMAHDPVNFHPLTNTGTTAVSREDFEAFVRATGHGFEVIDFTQLLTEAE